jgi:hypothetical protein
MGKNYCYYCKNLTDSAKTCEISFAIEKECPCKLDKKDELREELINGKRFIFEWKSYIECKDFSPEEKIPIEKCLKCGYNLGTKCFLHDYPARKHIGKKCIDYDKNPPEVEISKTKIYKKLNKKFKCRMMYDDRDMPISWKMAPGWNCELCLMRHGMDGCAIVDESTMKTLMEESQKEINGKK